MAEADGPVRKSYLSVTFGGGWHFIHSSEDRGKHVPILSVALSLLILAGFYGSPGPSPEQSAEVFSDFTYRGADPKSPWYTVLSTFVSHYSVGHMGSNLTNMFLAGVLLELTEGSLRLFCITWGSQTLAMGLYGAFDEHPVVGASGAVYGLMWAQLALLLLNWGQMTMWKFRVAAMFCLLAFDIFTWAQGMQETTAVGAHLGGAVASVCVGVVLGVNVERLPWELALNWVGAAGYALLCVVVVAHGQVSAALLAFALLVLVLLPWCVNEVRLARRMRAQVIQEPYTF